MTASRCPVLESFDPLAPEFLADPYTVLAALPLREAPLFYAPSIGYYVLTRHADIAQVFRDPATFSAMGRLETRLALEELARRYPRPRLAAGQELTFHPNISFRGPQVLRVRTG